MHPHPVAPPASRFQKILLLGSPGAGKSTLSRSLGRATGLPVVHLDKLYWKPGWVIAEHSVFLAQMEAALAQPAWIMDGNYGKTLERRLSHADAVLVLDYPAHLCILRATRRMLAFYGTVRADMSPGCPERFDAAFFRYILAFRSRQRVALFRALAGFLKPKLILTHPCQAAHLHAWLGLASSPDGTSAPGADAR